MRVVAIISGKGGCSKSTTAIHLAVAAERAGVSSLILDTDVQGTAERWAEWRKDEPPAVVGAKPATLRRMIDKALAGGAGLVVIDTPPNGYAEAREAAAVADLILIPCQPSAFDLDAIRHTAAIATATGKPSYVLVNMAHPSASTVIDDVAGVVDGLGLKVAPVRLNYRAAFRRSTGQGKTVMEAEPGGKAAEEVAALWQWAARELAITATKRRRAA